MHTYEKNCKDGAHEFEECTINMSYVPHAIVI